MADSKDKNPESEVDRALAEYMSHCDSGIAPDRSQFLARYSPELREQLSELLNVADLLDQFARQAATDPSQLGYSHVFGPEPAKSYANLSPGVDVGPLGEVGPESSDAHAGDVLSADSVSKVDPLSDTMPFAQRVLNPQASLSGDSLPSQLPRRFGDYELLRVLGRGGMGVVYFARQIQLDRPVAIKMIRSGALASGEEVARFYAEARSAAKLSHPRIVTVYQCGEHDGHHFFSMDYVEGTDLDKLMRERPLDGRRAARYVRDTAEAIHYAHENGILHRDLKPANVLVDRNDDVRITDFGLAKSVGNDNGLTASGAALGTPSFMSPEQAAGNNEEHTQATDVYSLGAILYTILTGTPPFRGESTLQTLLHVIHRPAPRLRTARPDVSEDLETIVEICLQKSPDKRYGAAAALAADLDRYLKGLPISARPVPKLRRAKNWVLGIPIVGAVLDNRVIEPSPTHRWAQRGMLSAGSMMLVAMFLMLMPVGPWFHERMPAQIRLAAGAEGGQYDLVAKAIANSLIERTECNVSVSRTQGSSDNIEHLSDGQAELALLQADMLEELNVAVVAPLYHEVIHVLRRADLPIKTLEDLRGRRVYLGREKAGSRATAQRLLDRSGVRLEQMEIHNQPPGSTAESVLVDAAILVAGVGAEEVKRLLEMGTYELMSLPNAWEVALKEPSFHPLYIEPKDYPGSDFGDARISTLATTAFLVCREDAAEVLVKETLNALYSPEVMSLGLLLNAEEAAHWQGLAWHPAARTFFRAYRGTAEVR